MQQQQPPQQQQPSQAQGQEQAQLQPGIPQDNPRLPVPQQGTPKFPSNLAGMMSPGSSIEQAARAVAAHHGGGSYGGGGGDYGAGRGGSNARVQGNLEVLSDTEGVDFGPYLSRVLDAVRRNWYNIIPEEARTIAGMNLRSPSGDVALDRAAWGGITASVPFAPLPGEYHGPYLALRFHFYYNPAKGDIE